MTDADVLTIVSRMTPLEREAIIERFTRLNPSWRGAHAADIIDTLDNADSDLDAVERAWDEMPGLRVPGFGFAARALLWSEKPLTEDNMRALLGLAPAPKSARIYVGEKSVRRPTTRLEKVLVTLLLVNLAFYLISNYCRLKAALGFPTTYCTEVHR